MDPKIITIYRADGTIEKKAEGFGGTLCKAATSPYAKRQNFQFDTPTSEAGEPPVKIEQLERVRSGG